jgi:hypothetical protein
MKINNDNRGQTLVELIVAIAIIEIGLFSVWSLFYVNFNAEREAEMRIVGVNLSREGVEVVKSVRDSNWLKSADNILNSVGQIWSWDEGLAPGTYAVNYNSDVLGLEGQDQLYYDANGFFTHIDTGPPAPFKRQIMLKNICCVDSSPQDLICDNNAHADYQIVDAGGDCQLKIGINVVTITSWFVRGQQRRSIIEDNLYNWK